MSTKIPFKYEAGAPAIITFTGIDGKKFEMSLAAIVFSVHDKGPADPEKRFDFRFHWQSDIVEVDTGKKLTLVDDNPPTK